MRVGGTLERFKRERERVCVCVCSTDDLPACTHMNRWFPHDHRLPQHAAWGSDGARDPGGCSGQRCAPGHAALCVCIYVVCVCMYVYAALCVCIYVV